MAMNAEYLRHIQEAEKAGNAEGVALLRDQQAVFNAARDAGLVTELPVTSSEDYAAGESEPVASQIERSLLVAEYKSQPHTPELVTATFQTIWDDRAERVADLLGGSLASVAGVDRTQEEIAQLEAEGRRLGYVPPELATQDKRHILGVMFPEMQCNGVRAGNTVSNEQVRVGWFDYEAAIEGPHPDKTERELEVIFARTGRSGMNLTEYVIAGQDSKLFTGKYLDQGTTSSRLPGSRNGGRVVNADFYPDGYLYVSSHLLPDSHYPSLRGRSVGVKK